MSTWLETVATQRKKVRPIRELKEEEIELFLFLERARERRARDLDVPNRAGVIVLTTVALASLFSFFCGGLVAWVVGRVFR